MERGWVLVTVECREGDRAVPDGTRFHFCWATPDLRPGLMNVVAEATGSIAARQVVWPAEAVIGNHLPELLGLRF